MRRPPISALLSPFIHWQLSYMIPKLLYVCEVTFRCHGTKVIEYFSGTKGRREHLILETVKWSMKKVRIKRRFYNI